MLVTGENKPIMLKKVTFVRQKAHQEEVVLKLLTRVPVVRIKLATFAPVF